MNNWHSKSIYYQLGNIGSEIGRALKWQKQNADIANRSAYRALELIDWSLADRRNISRFKEIARIREVFAETFYGDNSYGETMDTWNKYFYAYSLAANNE